MGNICWASLAAGRVEDRNLCKHGHEPGVLLGLGRMGTGIVATDDHKTSHRSDIGSAHQRIGGHIQPHLFHGHSRPFPCVRSHQGIFKGHLFVGGPLDIDVQVVLFFESDDTGQDF